MYLIKWNIYLGIKNESKVANEIKRISNLLELLIIDYSTSKKNEGYAVEFITHCRSLLKNDAIVEAINLSSKLGSGWCILPIQSSNDWLSFEGINPSDFRLSSITWAHFVLFKEEKDQIVLSWLEYLNFTKSLVQVIPEKTKSNIIIFKIKYPIKILELKETRFQTIDKYIK